MRFPSLLGIVFLALTSAALAAHTFNYELGESSNSERGRAETASKTEEEASNAVPKIGDELAASRPVTEEQLQDTRNLPICFDCEKLSALLEQKFDDKVYSDQQISEAIEAKDAEKLYDLVKDLICLHCLHSETLATTDCRDQVHQACLNCDYGRCLMCKKGGPHKDIHRETLLKKAPELLDWIPLKLPTGAFSTSGEPADYPAGETLDSLAELAMKHVKRFLDVSANIIREVASAINKAREASDSNGGMLRFIGRFREGRAIPRAIWGVTVYHKNIADESNERMAPPSELEEDYQQLFDLLTNDYMVPGVGTWRATDELLETLSIIRNESQTIFPDIKLDDAPSSVNVGSAQKNRPMLRRLSSLKKMGQSLACWNSRNVDIPSAPKIDITEIVVSWLRSLADGINRFLLNTGPETLIANKHSWISRLLGLHRMINILVETTIALKSQPMRMYNQQFMATATILVIQLFEPFRETRISTE